MISSVDMSTYFPLPVFHWLLQGNSGKQNSAICRTLLNKEKEINYE